VKRNATEILGATPEEKGINFFKLSPPYFENRREVL
jgi:hypothetical protein